VGRGPAWARMRQSRAVRGPVRRTLRTWGPWTRRGIIAAVLITAVVIPTNATSQATRHCIGADCTAAGSVLWTTRLSGSWLAVNGVAGTVPSQGEAYAGSAGGLAVLGYGTTVTGYAAGTGQLAWVTDLSSLQPDSDIVSVRVWPTAVAVGVSVPASGGAQQREEVILSAATGAVLHSYSAALYGGAILASSYSAVIVGPNAVTDYANRGGRVIWRQRIGASADWEVSRHYLYVVQTAAGYSSPAGAVSRIDLQTGKRATIRLSGGRADGMLAAIVGGVMLFSGGDGVLAYSADTGQLLWSQDPGVLDLVDHAGQAAYVVYGTYLAAIDARTGQSLGRASASVAASLYAVKAGIALGLDKGALGEAWGYSMTAKRVVWTSTALPWPHFFVDQSGLGGSVNRNGSVTLLATCGATGNGPAGGGGAVCLRPELAAVRY
jgi:PQQ-like domain